jgi:hypothetical protein
VINGRCSSGVVNCVACLNIHLQVWEPSVVEASPHELVRLDDPPGCRQREGGGELSRRLRQNTLNIACSLVD